jgi:hypothetical protein
MHKVLSQGQEDRNSPYRIDVNSIAQLEQRPSPS